ncbi:MAG: hypothetical protein MK101_05775 [Phycisphaerales bacterium]|nr:hypothetical protein [Phycisphaerales bacterium]
MSNAVRVKAFAPDGTPRMELDESTFKDLQSRGLIIEYQPGDTVHLNMQVDSDLVEVEGGQLAPVTLIVRQQIWLYSSPEGMLLSTDGSTFNSWRDAIDGGISFGVGLDGKNHRNTASLNLRGRLDR